MIATGWVTASLACRAIGLPCLAVVVFAELAVACRALALPCLAVVVFAEPAALLFVVPLALTDQTVFLLTLLACVAELRSDAVFVASPLFALADRVA
jgi:hypothetical protein